MLSFHSIQRRDERVSIFTEQFFIALHKPPRAPKYRTESLDFAIFDECVVFRQRKSNFQKMIIFVHSAEQNCAVQFLVAAYVINYSAGELHTKLYVLEIPKRAGKNCQK